MDHYLFPSEIVFETKLFRIAQDWEIPIAGFFILSSIRKIRSLSEFTDAESLEFISLLRKLRLGMHEELKIKDVYLFQNEDTKHGFHFWIFPRHNRMEPLGRKIQSVRTIMDYATKVQTIGPAITHAKEHRNTKEFCDQVRLYVRIMRDYMAKEYSPTIKYK